jgi:hypothetical protein
VEGTWLIHFNFAVRSKGRPHGDSISTLETVKVTCGQDCNSGTNASHTKTQKREGLEYPMASTPLADMHTAIGMVSMPPGQGDIKMTSHLPEGGLWKGQCHRIVFKFADAVTGQPLTDMQLFLGAAMHALIVADQEKGGEFHESDMMHTHGYPSQVDLEIVELIEKEAADICSMQIHSMNSSKAKIGPEIVMYARFQRSGRHHIFVQVCFFARYTMVAIATPYWTAVHWSLLNSVMMCA